MGLRYLHFMRKRKLLSKELKRLDKRSTSGKRLSFLILEQFSFHMFNNLSKVQVRQSAHHPETGMLSDYGGSRSTRLVNGNRACNTCWNFGASENLGLEKRTGKGGCE